MRSRTYEVTFAGEAGAIVLAEFDDCEVSVGPGATTLRLEISDQGALYGLLQRIAGFGLELARNLAAGLEQAGCRFTYLVRDRDPKLTAAFDAVFASTGIRILPIAPQAPKMNAYAERFVRPAPAECTDRMLVAGEQHLRAILSEYIGHYNTGRSHQGENMELRAPGDDPEIIALPVPATQIQRRARLAGLINEYEQAA